MLWTLFFRYSVPQLMKETLVNVYQSTERIFTVQEVIRVSLKYIQSFDNPQYQVLDTDLVLVFMHMFVCLFVCLFGQLISLV